MHDETVEGVLAQLQALSIPRSHLAHLTFIIPLYVGRVYPPMRRVQEVALLRPDGNNGLASQTIVSWDMGTDSFNVLPREEDRTALAAWAGMSLDELHEELRRREQLITGWLDSGATSIPEVNNAIEAFYSETAPTTPEG
jgi:hypothetical protein